MSGQKDIVQTDETPEPEAGEPDNPILGHVDVPFRLVKGSQMPEEWKEKLRRPKRTSNLPVPGRSAAELGLDMTGFTRMYKDLKRVKVTDEHKQLYCDRLMVHGKKGLAAVEIGVHYNTIREHIKADPEFASDVDEALRMRSQLVVDRLEEDALNGSQQLHYDKETGALISEQTKYETPLRLAMLRRHDPEYVDKKEMDVTHRGGVLVVPGRLTMESWSQLFEEKNDPTQPADEDE